jgi:hypothetical protein
MFLALVLNQAPVPKVEVDAVIILEQPGGLGLHPAVNSAKNLKSLGLGP